MTGTVAHKQCEVCWNNFAMDAADDEAYENALETIDIPVNPENHKWEEMGAEADCENEGGSYRRSALE